MPDAQLHLLGMVGMGRGDIHQIHRRIRQHLLIGTVRLAHALLPGEGPGLFEAAGCNGIERHRAAGSHHTAEGFAHGSGNGTCAEDGDIHRG